MREKVFISGATGVLGRRVLPALKAAGYAVAGLSRSDENDRFLESAGAEPRRADLFDPVSLGKHASDCQIFLHLATAIPTKARTTRRDWRTNDRIRREGTAAMLQAAEETGAEFFLTQSLVALHGNQEGAWVDGSTPIDPAPGGVLQSAVDLENKVERAKTRGLPACVLRFGMFYAAEAAQTKSMLQALARGFFPIIGDGDTYWNMIHADDAAKAILCAIERRDQAAGKTFDVADDEPVQVRDLLGHLAHKVQGPDPRSIPPWLARWLLGGHVVDYLLASVRCRNQPAKDELAWMLKHPTYRQGFDAILEQDLAADT